MKRKTLYQRLTKKLQVHLREAFDGPPSRVTAERIRDTLRFQREKSIRCFECEEIARRLGISVDEGAAA